MSRKSVLPWRFGFGSGRVFMRGDGWSEWFLRVGPLMVAVRDHRKLPVLFTERHRQLRHAWYWHIGPYCLHAKWGDRRP